MEIKIPIQGLQVFTFGIRFPGGVSQTPPHQEFKFLAFPLVGDDLVYHPLLVIWLAEVVVRVDFALWEQSVVIRVIRP